MLTVIELTIEENILKKLNKSSDEWTKILY